MINTMLFNVILKPTEVGSHLFKVKDQLETILSSVQSWKESGVDESGVVPIQVLSIETKTASVLSDVESLIKMISQVNSVRKRSKK